MSGHPVANETATMTTERVEAPVTVKAYLACAFAAFGGIFFGFDSGEYLPSSCFWRSGAATSW